MGRKQEERGERRGHSAEKRQKLSLV